MTTSKCVGCGNVGSHERIETPKPLRLCVDCLNVVGDFIDGPHDGDEDDEEDDEEDDDDEDEEEEFWGNRGEGC